MARTDRALMMASISLGVMSVGSQQRDWRPKTEDRRLKSPRSPGWLENHPLGQAYLSPFDVVFTRFDVVEPDLLYLSNERAAAVLTDANVQGTPELVVEIGSPSTRKRDETIKRHLYERAGVSEYWIVDPDVDVVRVYRRGVDGFDRPLELRLDRRDVLTTSLLPELELPLERIFRD